MRNILLATFIFLTIGSASAQYMRGMSNSNYAGLQGVFFNPANLADSRARFEFHLVSGYVDANNNHIQIETPYSQWKALRGTLPDHYLDQNGVALYKNEYAREKFNGKRKNVYASAEITGPSFMFNMQDQSGFAFSNRTRMFAHAAGLNEDLLKIFLEDLDTTGADYVNKQNQKRYVGARNSQRNFGVGASAFEEFGFSYARVLHNKKENFLKGGVTLKYLIGMGAAHLQVKDLDYELVAEDSIHIYSADMSLAYVSESYYENEELRLNDLLGKNKLANGFGVDFGFVYEYRPDYKYYKYKVDRKTREDRSVNKYKFKLGASINDFGAITYNNSDFLTSINIRSEDLVKWSNFNSAQDLGGTTDADSLVYDLWADSDSVNRYKSKLPTSLNVNFDYQIQKNWYVGGSYVQSLRGKRVAGVKKQNVIALNARYETKWYEATLMVLGGNWYHPVHMGAMLRIGPVYFGSDHLGSLFTPKRTDGVNVYAGVKLPIHYHRIKDSDNDGVSDEKDQCVDVPGSVSAHGCPDEDGDKVPDKDDKCPDLPGKRITKGCPDEDGDKVVGDDDKCPDKAGPKESAGCPDTDGDGLADHEDRCPNEKGSKELNGCPYKEKTDTTKVEQPKVEKPKEKPKTEQPKKDPRPKTQEPTGLETKYDDIIDKMDFDQYNYYIILGAYTNKDYADYLVDNLDKKAGVETFIFREVEGTTYYVTFGKASNRKTAQEQVLMLERPEVSALINGHIWWKKIPR